MSDKKRFEIEIPDDIRFLIKYSPDLIPALRYMRTFNFTKEFIEKISTAIWVLETLHSACVDVEAFFDGALKQTNNTH